MSQAMHRTSTLAGLLLGCVLATDAAVAQTMNVSYPIVVFTGIVGGSAPPAQIDSITSTGGPFTWQISNGKTLAPWLSVTPQSGGAPGGLGLAVNVAGLAAGVYKEAVDVASNSPATPVQTIQVVLILKTSPFGQMAGKLTAAQIAQMTQYLATYQIVLEFVGISGHHAETAADCGVRINPNGHDVLVGTVSGFEDPTTPNEEVVYTGTLQRATDMDYCDLTGPPDQKVDCADHLVGAALTDVELAVYGETGRGAYLKTAPASVGPRFVRVTGRCDETQQIQLDYNVSQSAAGGGGSPNGQPIEDPQSRLFTGGLARLAAGLTFPANRPTSIWELRVIRKIP